MESEIWGYIGQTAYTLGGLLIGWLWRSLKVSRKEYALIREGVCALLRDRLLYRLEKCLDGGYCLPKCGKILTICFMCTRNWAGME